MVITEQELFTSYKIQHLNLKLPINEYRWTRKSLTLYLLSEEKKNCKKKSTQVD